MKQIVAIVQSTKIGQAKCSVKASLQKVNLKLLCNSARFEKALLGMRTPFYDEERTR